MDLQQHRYGSLLLTFFFGTFVFLVFSFLFWFLPSSFYHRLHCFLGLCRLFKRLHGSGSSDFTALLCLPGRKGRWEGYITVPINHHAEQYMFGISVPTLLLLEI